MKKSRKLRYLKRPLAAILALMLTAGGISYTPPTAEAAKTENEKKLIANTTSNDLSKCSFFIVLKI